MENNLHWDFFINKRPPRNIISQWNDISENNVYSCASSFPEFSINSSVFLKENDLIYAFAFNDGEMLLAVPLFIKKKRICFLNVSVLQVLNHDHLDTYVFAGQNNLLINDLVDELRSSLCKNLPAWDYFQARNLIVGTDLSELHQVPFYNKESAYFDIKDKGAITEVMSKKMLKNVNRLEKKLVSKDDVLELKCFSTVNDVTEALDRFVELEGSGWKGELNTSISSEQETMHFYNKTWRSFSENGKARIYLLYLNDKIIAGAISFRHSSNIYLHKIAYSEELTQFGPGSMLVKKVIERSLVDSSINSVNLNTSPKWAQRWHPEIIKLQAIEYFNYSIKGVLLKGFFTSHRTLKNLKQYLIYKANTGR